ncbi:Hypothetical protein SCLAV_2725 [Streptomyces clavuligerus]|uniref:Uncharacterized protein n=1 Tax=Streptomyces clavuligerus TaxID=1901 RepID=E2PUL8_STRCL|nr:Hypothetical protein SCLAV_2725 [Streptomyces clavuligerus]
MAVCGPDTATDTGTVTANATGTAMSMSMGTGTATATGTATGPGPCAPRARGPLHRSRQSCERAAARVRLRTVRTRAVPASRAAPAALPTPVRAWVRAPVRASSARPVVPSAAFWRISVTLSGWDIIATCEELTSTVCDLARFASKRSRSGAMALSFLATTNQEGMSRHAALVAFCSKHAAAMGRCSTAITLVSASARSAAKTLWNMSFLMYRSCPLVVPSVYSTGRSAGWSSLPVNFMESCPRVSPLSGMNAET